MRQKKDKRAERILPVLDYRFDQKNEIYKRNRWDEKVRSNLKSYSDVTYKEDLKGYGKIDFSLRNAAWSLEHVFAFGNQRSNFGLYAWEGIPDKVKFYSEVGDQVKKSPEEMSHIIKKAARFLGADLVGICRLHPNWVYSHEFNLLTFEHYPIEVPKGCDNAVVMAVEMDREAIRSSPTAVAGAATGLGYSDMAYMARMMAIFIRGLGYQAIPCGNDTALSVPLALAAGLGEESRMGLVVTEKFGPRIRLCKVFTDLPLHYDTYRPFGVVEFCRSCKKCAKHCPGQAIPSGEMTTEGPNMSSHSGLLKWYVDAEKCYSFWARNKVDCQNCIRVCPFNKSAGIVHDLARTIIRKTPLFNRTFARLDNLLGYGKPYPAQKFWEKG